MMAAGEGILDADDGFGHPWIVAMHHSSPGGMDLAYATLAAKAKLAAPWWRFGKTIMAWAAISLASFLLLAQLWMRERRRSYFEARDLVQRSEEHTSELQSPCNLVCRLLLEKKKKIKS